MASNGNEKRKTTGALGVVLGLSLAIVAAAGVVCGAYAAASAQPGPAGETASAPALRRRGIKRRIFALRGKVWDVFAHPAVHAPEIGLADGVVGGDVLVRRAAHAEDERR